MKQPLGIKLLGLFLMASTGILVATTVTLLYPGTVVDRIWDFKRSEYEQLLPFRLWAGTGFLVLGVVMAFAAYGWWKVRRWAWWLVQGILMSNGLGDAVRAFRGDLLGGLVGVVIVAAIIAYVRSRGVSTAFGWQR